jgi:DNA-binding response OmpR family regulator
MEKPKKILVVDDEADMRRIISVRLEINGYNVITADDGEEALEKTKKERPDLIVLDLMLPKISGFEVCRMLKFDKQYKEIPIMILSALDQQADREKAAKCGADAYFIKPFDLELLIKKTKDLLER